MYNHLTDIGVFENGVYPPDGNFNAEKNDKPMDLGVSRF
jgi:hypothetical protein